MGAAIAAAVIAAGGAAYAGYASNKASKEAANSLNQRQLLDLETIPNPELVDWMASQRNAIGSNYNNLPMNFALANQVNKFNVGQAVRGYSTIQPYFKQLQEQIGRNASSFAAGQLPSDVVSSIGRAAAQRGLQGGFGQGASGGGPGTALGSLNLRNLGLTSLDLSKQGTQLAMQANQSAAQMTPALFDPASMFITPNAAAQFDFQNAGILNRWNEANTQIRNAESSGNTELLNSILEAQTGLKLQGQLAQAQAVQSASSSVAGIMGGMGGMGGGGGAGMNSQGFFSSPQAARMGSTSGSVTNSPYGYAVRPQTL